MTLTTNHTDVYLEKRRYIRYNQAVVSARAGIGRQASLRG